MTDDVALPPLCLLIPDTDDGGLYRLALSLVRRAPSDVRTLVISVDEPGPLAVEFEHANAPLFSLELPPARGGVKEIRRFLSGVLRLYLLLRKIEPTPAVLHVLGGESAAIGRIGARLAGVRHVVETHKAPPRADGWLNGFLGRVTAGQADAVFGLTRAVAEAVTARWSLRRQRVHALAPGIETGRLSVPERAKDLPTGGPIIGSMARWTEEKDGVGLLDAFEILRRFHEDAKLLVIGAGPLGLPLMHLARRRGFGDAVIMAGERSDVGALFKGMDVFVMPSRRDGCPFSLLEAMGAGVPCVATDLPAIREIVRRDVDALLVKPGHPALLADAIDRLLMDRELALRLAATAKDAVLDHFRMGPLTAAIHQEHLRRLKRS